MQGSQQPVQPPKQKIVTIVRIRPMLTHQSEKQVITQENRTTLKIDINGSRRIQTIQMGLGHQTTQRQLFEVVEPLIRQTMNGFNISLLTYGQTGSGKTHTMFGSDWSNIIRRQNDFQQGDRKQQSTFLRSIQQDENYAGIIPRVIHLLFSEIITQRRKHIKIYCSFLQIYNQQMADLLQNDPKLAKDQKLVIHQNKQDGIYVEGLNQIVVDNPEQCLQLMRRGERNRVVRQTHMNIKSSRSHTIFTLLIEEVFPSKKSYRRMKINLCDLAGSQKIHKNQSISAQHYDQLRNINLSLTTLGKVISSLSSSKAVPPYRQSKLTRLLQDSLGGNTNTAIIATITPKLSCLEQSLNTLRFLERARQIKGQVVAKMYSDNPQMRNLQRQISYLRDMLKMRGGNIPSDMEIRQRYKHLQIQNSKLKQIIDANVIQKLKKENSHLKQQLQIQKNDILSDSFIGKMQPNSHYKTIDQSETAMQRSSEIIHPIFSQGHNRKRDTKKEDIKSLGTRTDEALSHQSSTYHRGTGLSMFPSLGKGSSVRSSNKILDRIMQIERAKQTNRLKLEYDLQKLSINRKSMKDDKKMTRFSKN